MEAADDWNAEVLAVWGHTDRWMYYDAKMLIAFMYLNLFGKDPDARKTRTAIKRRLVLWLRRNGEYTQKHKKLPAEELYAVVKDRFEDTKIHRSVARFAEDAVASLRTRKRQTPKTKGKTKTKTKAKSKAKAKAKSKGKKSTGKTPTRMQLLGHLPAR